LYRNQTPLPRVWLVKDFKVMDSETILSTMKSKEFHPDKEVLHIENPALLPERFDLIEEPFVLATIFIPSDFIGPVLDLCQEKRGIQKSFTYIAKDRIRVEYELPLNEILWDFNSYLAFY
jgi:GTP-binding protein LepA